MAVDGKDFASDPTGVTLFAVGSDGRLHPLKVDTNGAIAVAGIGTADDDPGDPTVIGLLKQIAANTTT